MLACVLTNAASICTDKCSPVCSNPSPNISDQTVTTLSCQVTATTVKDCSTYQFWSVNNTLISLSSRHYKLFNKCSEKTVTASVQFALNSSYNGCYHCGSTTVLEMQLGEQTIPCYEPLCIGVGCNSKNYHH